MAAEASFGAATDDSAPMNAPMGVRLAPTMAMRDIVALVSVAAGMPVTGGWRQMSMKAHKTHTHTAGALSCGVSLRKRREFALCGYLRSTFRRGGHRREATNIRVTRPEERRSTTPVPNRDATTSSAEELEAEEATRGKERDNRTRIHRSCVRLEQHAVVCAQGKMIVVASRQEG